MLLLIVRNVFITALPAAFVYVAAHDRSNSGAKRVFEFMHNILLAAGWVSVRNEPPPCCAACGLSWSSTSRGDLTHA